MISDGAMEVFRKCTKTIEPALYASTLARLVVEQREQAQQIEELWHLLNVAKAQQKPHANAGQAKRAVCKKR